MHTTHRRLLVAIAILSALPTGYASADDSDEQPGLRGRPGFGAPWGRDAPRPPAPRPPEPTTIETGFVFIDGEYVAPPYSVRRSAEGVTVNDRTAISYRPRSSEGSGDRGRERSRGSFRGWGRPPFGGGGWLGTGEIEAALSNEDVVWFQSNRTRTLGRTGDGYTLLKKVLGEEDEVDLERFGSLGDEIVEALNVGSFPSELLAGARTQVDRLEDAWEAERIAAEAQSWLDRLNFPLTMIGMLCAAAAIGHLLVGWPQLARDQDDPERTGLGRRILLRSVAFVVVFSALDLVWTILASRAGTMLELNPIAARFVSDPATLALFKVTATLIGAGLLVGLRQHRVAQMASCWLCLVTTLLTCRWLTYGSLFTS